MCVCMLVFYTRIVAVVIERINFDFDNVRYNKKFLCFGAFDLEFRM